MQRAIDYGVDCTVGFNNVRVFTSINAVPCSCVTAKYHKVYKVLWLYSYFP